MRLKDFKLLAITLLLSSYALAQHTISGTVIHSDTGEGIADVQIYNKAKGQLTETNADGSYTFQTDRPQLQLVFFSYDFQVEERLVSTENNTEINICSLKFFLSRVIY